MTPETLLAWLRSVNERARSISESAGALASELDSVISASGGPAGQVDFYEEVDRFKAMLISWALGQSNGSQRKAARLLGINASSLHWMVGRYKLREKAGAHGP
ncbi:MAG: hypothetical protein M3348_09530 [Acidobacteriota bacterium]|nr:hypothetical protein [Acidobacteriota bacterium]